MSGEYIFFDREEVETPKNQNLVMVDYWWPVNDIGQVAMYQFGRRGQHPLFPQANLDRSIAESVGKQTIPNYAGVIQIHTAFIEHRCDS